MDSGISAGRIHRARRGACVRTRLPLTRQRIQAALQQQSSDSDDSDYETEEEDEEDDDEDG